MAGCKSTLRIGDHHSVGCRNDDSHEGMHQFAVEWDGDGAVKMNGYVQVAVTGIVRSGAPGPGGVTTTAHRPGREAPWEATR